MKRFIPVLAVLLLSGPLLAQQPPSTQQSQQQQQQQDAEERRREAERIAAEKAKAEERKRESEARLEEFRKLRPPTPEERRATHLRQMSDFLKNVRRFDRTSREIVALDANDRSLAKKAKSLNDTTGDVLRYVLFEASAPTPPAASFESASMMERIKLVAEKSGPLHQALNEWAASQKKPIVDVGKTTALIRDLQSFTMLVRSLYSPGLRW